MLTLVGSKWLSGEGSKFHPQRTQLETLEGRALKQKLLGYCGLLVNGQWWERWNAQLGYMKCEQGWESYQMMGGCQWHIAKYFQNQLEFSLIRWRTQQLSANKVVVVASSHHRSPGSITGESQMRGYVTVSQEAKLINFDIVNP